MQLYEWIEDLKRTGQPSPEKKQLNPRNKYPTNTGQGGGFSNNPFETYTQVFPKMVREDPPTDLIMASWIEILSKKTHIPKPLKFADQFSNKSVNLKVTTTSIPPTTLVIFQDSEVLKRSPF